MNRNILAVAVLAGAALSPELAGCSPKAPAPVISRENPSPAASAYREQFTGTKDGVETTIDIAVTADRTRGEASYTNPSGEYVVAFLCTKDKLQLTEVGVLDNRAIIEPTRGTIPKSGEVCEGELIGITEQQLGAIASVAATGPLLLER